MATYAFSNRKWKKAELYVLYWLGYLLLFTLVEGSTERDFFNVFRNELIGLAPKVLFVWLILDKLFYNLLNKQKFARAIITYALLTVIFAITMRVIDNYI